MISIAVALAFMSAGVLISTRLFKNETGFAQLTLGMSVGLVLMMWVPALTAFIWEFGGLEQVLSAVGVGAVSLICLFHRITNGWKFRRPENPPPKILFRMSSLKRLYVLLPVYGLYAYLLYTHILLPDANGNLHCGQSTFGDMPMHLGFITSISQQKTFPPFYNLLGAKTVLGYPFLCDSISSTLYSLGVGLRTAYIFPMLLAGAVVFASVYMLFENICHDRIKAAAGFILFFIGGGFGFAYFFEGLRENPGNFFSIFSNFYTTPMNYTDKNIIWVNVIADLLVPQRATLFGWAILIPCIFLLYRAAFCGRREYFPILGIMAGSLPLIHTHSFLALGVLSLVYLLINIADGGFYPGCMGEQFAVWDPEGFGQRTTSPKIKWWLVYAAIALALAAPQLWFFTFRQAAGDGFLRFHFNWANNGDNFFWFYIKNMGLVFLLIPPAFLNAGRDMRRLYAGGLAVWALAEFVVFQPNEYDNNKLLFIWYLLSCGLVADYAVEIYRAFLRQKDGQKNRLRGGKILAVLMVVLCNISGVLTLCREAVSDYEIFPAPQVRASEFIMDNTRPDSLFLTASNHNNAVAALAGRNIFCGSGSYLFFHGINYAAYELTGRGLFENPSLDGLEAARIDFIYISDYERYSGLDIDEQFFDAHLEKVYDEWGIKIYKMP